MTPLWQRLAESRVIDLAQPLHRGMPVSPNHPAFELALMRRHGDMVRPDGGSAANELIITGGHVGTHIDALAHVSHAGRLHGNVDPGDVQSQHGFSRLGVDQIEPIVCRGVMLDIAALHEVEALEPGYEVTIDDLIRAGSLVGVAVRTGDAVLLRTGWARHWGDPLTFTGQRHGAPGPGAPAAGWLAEKGVRLVGGETIAFEVIAPGEGHTVLPVHRILLVEAGVHIIEVMNLSDLAAAGVAEFSFVAAPLKLVGATGSPIRPLAVVEQR